MVNQRQTVNKIECKMSHSEFASNVFRSEGKLKDGTVSKNTHTLENYNNQVASEVDNYSNDYVI